MKTIILCPNMVAGAVSRSLELPFAAFEVAKYLDMMSKGQGIIPMGRLLEAIVGLGDMSRSTMYRAVERGCGLFWTRPFDGRQGRCVKLNSHKRVAAELWVPMFRSSAYRLDPSQLGYKMPDHDLGRLEALMIALVAAKDPLYRPISVATISDLAGISERTCQRKLRESMKDSWCYPKLFTQLSLDLQCECPTLEDLTIAKETIPLEMRHKMRVNACNGKYSIYLQRPSMYALAGVPRTSYKYAPRGVADGRYESVAQHNSGA